MTKTALREWGSALEDWIGLRAICPFCLAHQEITADTKAEITQQHSHRYYMLSKVICSNCNKTMNDIRPPLHSRVNHIYMTYRPERSRSPLGTALLIGAAIAALIVGVLIFR